MAPGWFAPPGPHAIRPQQAQQAGNGRFHPATQRMPSGGGGGGGAVGINGGVNSPHGTHTYHQRNSPPMRGPYHGGPRPHAPPPPPPPHGVVAHAPPHGGGPHGHRGMPPGQGSGGRFQMPHPPQAMVAVGGPRSLPPPNSHTHTHTHTHAAGPVPAGHSHSHSHMQRHHHAPSPGMPRRMQIPPPNAMRPIPQQARPSFEKQRVSALQQHGLPRGMHQHQQHQHMMRMQQEHQQQQQQMHQQRSTFHHHHPPPPPPTGTSSAVAAAQGENVNHQMQRQISGGGGESHSDNPLQQQHHYQPQPPAPGTPEQRPAAPHGHGTHSRSPSPPPIPPPNYQQGAQQEQLAEGPSSQRPSPSSLPDNHSEVSSLGGGEHNSAQQQYHHHHPGPPPIAKTPSWNSGPGMGPLRESRLQNMPQKRLMVPMQQHPHHHQSYHHHPHAQRPIPQHPNSVSTNAYINENMERFRAMELKHGGGPPHPPHGPPPPHHHHHHHHLGGMKPIHHPPPQHPPHQILHPSARTLLPSPGQPMHHHQVLQQHHHQHHQKPESRKGPDITMDAASMLLALRTSASPSTVSAATLEEQASRDHSEVSKKTNAVDQQDHDDLEDDDVPALSSSSSSLSAPPPKPPPVQHHEVPKNFPTRLALPNDEAKLNSLHCFLRSELLEIFVVERSANKSPTHSPGSSVGRVGLRCVFCAMVRKRHAMCTTAEHDTTSGGTPQQPRPDEAPMAVFYPKSIAEIYRLVTSWQRCHLRKCRNLPPDIRSKWTLLRENDKSRGKTHYWITSAKEIGLIDCNSRAGGIRFATPRSNSAASGSIATAVSGVADNDSIVSEGLSYTTTNQGQESDGLHNKNNNTINNNTTNSNTQGYQPHSNPNFMEGPSQKHREAVSHSATLSTIESPLKRASGEDQPTGKAPGDVNLGSENAPADTKVSSSNDDFRPPPPPPSGGARQLPIATISPL